MELSQKAAAEAVKFIGRSSQAHTLLAHHHLRKREFDSAQQEAAISLKLDPRNVRAAIILGACPRMPFFPNSSLF
jgi:lipopolysaccharide biosynthesis regulator YciM